MNLQAASLVFILCYSRVRCCRVDRQSSAWLPLTDKLLLAVKILHGEAYPEHSQSKSNHVIATEAEENIVDSKNTITVERHIHCIFASTWSIGLTGRSDRQSMTDSYSILQSRGGLDGLQN